MTESSIDNNVTSLSILSDVTVHMKYAKYIEELQRRETYEEICDRNMGMHIKKYPQLEDEIKSIYTNFVKTKKILPSMRSMQFAGTPIERNPTRIYNCSYLPVDNLLAFSEVLFLLLGGIGVGYSVQNHHIEKLPEIRKPNPKKYKRFLIGDSIEGWADSIKVLMKSYFNGGSTINFDYGDIRPKGARLITAGGKAPGPDPLKECHLKVTHILNQKEDGEQLTSLEVHDIMCHLADAVLAGGIRRAAMISLFDADDIDMISCKSGNWWELNPQRGRANNSAVLLRNKITQSFFNDLWKRIENSKAGEPGIFFTNDKDWGVNPCVEVSLRANQFCVSGDTKIITRDGIDTIKNLTGKDVDIWNGVNWSTVNPYKTGDEDVLHRVWLNDGSYLDATNNHKFLVKNRFEKEFREIETIELIELLKTTKYQLQLPRADIKYNDGISNENAYNYGFVLGDGHVHRKSNMVVCDLFGDKRKINFNNIRVIGNYLNYNKTEFTSVEFNIDKEFSRILKYDTGLPSEIFTWDRESILKFIAGWADSDGTQASRGIRIYGNEVKLRDAQLLLTKIGINSSVNLMSKKGDVTNYGERKTDVWYLQITRTVDIPCQRLKCENDKLPTSKGMYQLIKRIDTLDGLHESYCLTENELHQCVFNNVLTKQCNLCEVNVSDITSQEDLNDRVKAASFIGTLQAGYTDFHYLRPIWKKTTEKEALIGVGLTGIGSGAYTKYDLTEAGDIVKIENERVANLINTNKAARCNVIKPAGTSSLVLGTASGVHAWHNDYYIRRIRVNKNEAIYTYLSIYHPGLIKDEYFAPHKTAVIEIPVKSPDNAIYRTETPIETLERVKHFHTNWIKPGHRKGQNTNNVSATISIKDDEWGIVGEWMWKNRNSYTGISVLPYDGGSYIQAPFEDITKEEYDEMVKTLHSIDLTKVVELADETDLSGELACGADGCIIV